MDTVLVAEVAAAMLAAEGNHGAALAATGWDDSWHGYSFSVVGVVRRSWPLMATQTARGFS